MQGKIIKGIAGFYYVHVPELGYEPEIGREPEIGHEPEQRHDQGIVPDSKGDMNQGCSLETGIIACRARGIFRNQNRKPLVGDNVEITISETDSREGTIQELLPRSSSLIRPAVANVDQALVLFAAAEPEPNLNLLDRFLVYLERQRIPAVICFNKSDLANEKQLDILRQTYAGCGYPVYVISVFRQEGTEEIRKLLARKTTVLAGPSGVGKSSLTNLLIPEAEMETGQVSEKIKRGRHTTRHSELFSLGGHSYLMDTPGFASLELLELEKEELWHYFREFEPYEPYCRFQGCVHIGERECGVKDALAQGEIAGSRYQSYQQLYEELRQQKKY